MSADISDVAGVLRSSLRGSVSESPDDLKSYATLNPILDPGQPPALVVKPADVADLQELVRIAGSHGIGLVPVSSQAPHIKGGINCAGPHLIVDLSAWKNQCEVNRRNRVCVIDPGITYGHLQEVLEPHGLTVSMPLAPRSGKSVLAAVMDREPSTWPNRQWDISDPAGSTEFIFGTGDVFRTGAAGGPGSIEAQRKVGGAQKSPLGPSQTDFHRVVQGSQGSMGMVTWITVRVELKPSIEEPRLLGAKTLTELIPFVYEVQRPWLGEQCFILDRFAAALLMPAGGAGGATLQSLPEFVCLINVAGFERLPRERVAYQLRDIGDISSRNSLSPVEAMGGLSARDLLKKAASPCGRDDFRHGKRGHCLSIFFLSTLDRASALIEVFAQTAAKHGLARDRFGVYIQPVVQNHGCHIELMMPFDPGDAGEVELMRRFEQDAVTALAEAGAFFSRPYGTAAAVAFARNPLNTSVLKKMKGIFDPGRVLSPGRFGL